MAQAGLQTRPTQSERDGHGVVVLPAPDAVAHPAGWKAMVSGGAADSVAWRVASCEREPGRAERCLELAENRGARGQLNLCVLSGGAQRDVQWSGWCHGAYGVGLAWRVQDAENYYVARVNVMEGNFNVYKVVSGKRSRIAGQRLRLADETAWHHVQVQHRGAQLRCRVGDQPWLELTDSSLEMAGAVGVWTRADAVGRFTALQLGALDELRAGSGSSP